MGCNSFFWREIAVFKVFWHRIQRGHLLSIWVLVVRASTVFNLFCSTLPLPPADWVDVKPPS